VHFDKIKELASIFIYGGPKLQIEEK